MNFFNTWRRCVSSRYLGALSIITPSHPTQGGSQLLPFCSFWGSKTSIATQGGSSARMDIFPILTCRCRIPFSLWPSQNSPQRVLNDFLQCKSKGISLDYHIQTNSPSIFLMEYGANFNFLLYFQINIFNWNLFVCFPMLSNFRSSLSILYFFIVNGSSFAWPHK